MPFEESQIKSFYKNQTIFLTGGTGFVGKVLLEKLLRVCDLDKIYVLMRTKKNKTPEERFDELFSYPCFDKLKARIPQSLKKVVLVSGDCQVPELGLSPEDCKKLIEETTCVIHAAANVKFDQTLKEATNNVRATRDLLEMAKQMKKLKIFVFISTAYSNCINQHIVEDFYEPPIKCEGLFSIVDSLDDKTLENITPSLLKEWPNTYVYTKSVSEDLIKRASKDIPLVMIRPGIIGGSFREPEPGWIDNFYGPTGIVTVAALGILRSMYVKKNCQCYLVPVDYVTNCILASAWRRAKSNSITIYNYVGHKTCLLTWGKFMEFVEGKCWKVPTTNVVWYFCFKLRENETWHKICVFFLHTVVAYIVDFILLCLGRPRIAVAGYRRLNKTLDTLSYFAIRTWKMDHDNVYKLWNEMNEEDKGLFPFNMQNYDWDVYSYRAVFGARKYLLKESLDTLPRGERWIKFLCFAHYATLAVLYYLLYKFIMFLYSIVF